MLVTYFPEFTLSEFILSSFNLNHSFNSAKALLMRFLKRSAVVD